MLNAIHPSIHDYCGIHELWTLTKNWWKNMEYETSAYICKYSLLFYNMPYKITYGYLLFMCIICYFQNLWWNIFKYMCILHIYISICYLATQCSWWNIDIHLYIFRIYMYGLVFVQFLYMKNNTTLHYTC
jgi:hypothetical protein